MNDDFQYKVGMEIGLIDPIEMTKDSVKWYTIIKIEPDSELDIPIAYMYLESNDSSENIHQTFIIDDNGISRAMMYAEMIDSISDLIVIP